MIETILTSSNLISAICGSVSTGVVAYFSFLKSKDKDKIAFQQMEREYMETLRSNMENLFREEQTQLRTAFAQERQWLMGRVQELEQREYILQNRLSNLEAEFEAYKQNVHQVIQAKDNHISKLTQQLQAAHGAIYISEQEKLTKLSPKTKPSVKSEW